MKNRDIALTDAQRSMVEANMDVVRWVIRTSIQVNEQRYGFGYDDLFQEGCIWLCKAAVTYDPDGGASFPTYAQRVVENGLRTYCRLQHSKELRSFPVSEIFDTEADSRRAMASGIRSFQEQLRKCRTGYFDFYLLHALNRGNWETVKRCGLYDFVRRMQKEGKIRYVGFSFHDSPDVLKTIAEAHPWDFVQLQINYLDWHNYRSREQYEIVTKLGIPVIVMAPLRGGTLATLTPEATKILTTSAPDASPADWAFRYVASLPNVICVLSGMNRMDHLKENLRVYSPLRPLSDSERLTLASALAAYQKVDSVPCTACNYCVPCPVEVAIPRVFGAYDQYKIDGNFAAFKKAIDALPNEGGPASCVSCGVCLKKCPQKIDIPTQMKRIAAELKKK